MGLFLSPLGLVALAALDSSVVFFLPLALDLVVVLMAAEHGETFWLYPLLATARSTAGALATWWIGRKVGEEGLERLVSRERLERAEARIGGRGAMAFALPALVPPPFPFTAYIVGAGALDVDPWRFLATLAGVRLFRFGAEAALASIYGEEITSWMESTSFAIAVGVVARAAVAGTAWGLWRVLR